MDVNNIWPLIGLAIVMFFMFRGGGCCGGHHSHREKHDHPNDSEHGKQKK